MKIKRLSALLLTLVMCFVLVSCKRNTNVSSTQTPAQITENPEATTEITQRPTTPKPSQSTQTPEASQSVTSTPLLYRVTAENGNIMWLFGSIHVGKESYYPLPDYVQNAFEGSESLAVELDILAFEKDVKLQMSALSKTIYMDGSTIEDHIPKELYEKAVKILKEYKYYSKFLDMYTPALWGSMIDSFLLTEFGVDSDLGVDRHLIKIAYEKKKEIIEIESAEFQYKMLADFDDDVQYMILASSVESYENKEKSSAAIDKMMDLWASGNENAFIEYLKDSDRPETEAEEKYNQVVVRDRNIVMADFAEEVLLSGKEVFVCVGAAHIVGEGAVAEILSQRGYSVECITK